MVNLEKRSHQKELLDADDISFADIKICMQELNKVNTLLGGHNITLAGLKQFITPRDNQLHICEIGCGGGDNLKAIDKRYALGNISLKFTGIDIKNECTHFAEQQYPEMNADWLTNDYRKTGFSGYLPDVIFSSLFCHHFTDEQIVDMLMWMEQNSKRGFFINDLQRSPVAYYSIKWITRFFSGSYLVKNDAAISVARSFRKKDWVILFEKAGLSNYTIQWKWAFRYLIVYKK